MMNWFGIAEIIGSLAGFGLFIWLVVIVGRRMKKPKNTVRSEKSQPMQYSCPQCNAPVINKQQYCTRCGMPLIWR